MITRFFKEKCDKICKRKSSNCPTKLKDCGNLKPQPGDYHLLITQGSLNNKKRIYKCDEMEKK